MSVSSRLVSSVGTSSGEVGCPFLFSLLLSLFWRYSISLSILFHRSRISYSRQQYCDIYISVLSIFFYRNIPVASFWSSLFQIILHPEDVRHIQDLAINLLAKLEHA